MEYDSEIAKSYLAGGNKFRVEEIETFKIIFQKWFIEISFMLNN